MRVCAHNGKQLVQWILLQSCFDRLVLLHEEGQLWMRYGTKNRAAKIAHAIWNARRLFANRFAALVEARSRRILCNQDFYRTYEGYCSVHHLPAMWADEWNALRPNKFKKGLWP